SVPNFVAYATKFGTTGDAGRTFGGIGDAPGNAASGQLRLARSDAFPLKNTHYAADQNSNPQDKADPDVGGFSYPANSHHSALAFTRSRSTEHHRRNFRNRL